MGVMATQARHRIARLALANVLRQRFALVQGAQFLLAVEYIQVIVHIVRQILTGTKIRQVPARLLNRNVALQMARHAHGIASRGEQL
jgi:hypothetical protein